MQEASSEAELSPAVRELAESFRRRLGTLDPQQVAIWRQMTPARKLQLLFQLWYFARKVAWTTERQAHPDASLQELGWRVLRRMQEAEADSGFQAQWKEMISTHLTDKGIPWMASG